MATTLKYKGFQGSFDYQSDASYFFGQVLLERDTVSYKAATLNELQQSFQDSIDHYLADCAALGIEPG